MKKVTASNDSTRRMKAQRIAAVLLCLSLAGPVFFSHMNHAASPQQDVSEYEKRLEEIGTEIRLPYLTSEKFENSSDPKHLSDY